MALSNAISGEVNTQVTTKKDRKLFHSHCATMFVCVCVFLLATITPCYGDDGDQGKLQISPLYPVRLRGQSLEIYVDTWEKFLEHIRNYRCLINDDIQLEVHSTDPEKLTASFNHVFEDLVDSSSINATVINLDTMESFFIQTYLLVVPGLPKSIVLEEGKESTIHCLDPSKNYKKLKFDWLRNNETIDTHDGMTLSVKAGKADVTANFTCRIATEEAVEYYGSIEAAFNAGSATSVQRNISVVSIERKPIKGDICNVSVHLESNSWFDMSIRDMDGIVLESGYPTIGVQVNNCATVQITISDGSTVLLSKNDTTEIPADEENGLPIGAIIAIPCVIIVLIIIVIVVYCCWKRKKDQGKSVNSTQMESLDEEDPLNNGE